MRPWLRSCMDACMWPLIYRSMLSQWSSSFAGDLGVGLCEVRCIVYGLVILSHTYMFWDFGSCTCVLHDFSTSLCTSIYHGRKWLQDIAPDEISRMNQAYSLSGYWLVELVVAYYSCRNWFRIILERMLYLLKPTTMACTLLNFSEVLMWHWIICTHVLHMI
jgi:hypothetical protein